jgi:hypothetical protein
MPKFPKTAGACIDLLWKIEQRRAVAQRAVEEIKKEYQELENHLLNELPKDELDGAIGKLAQAKIKYTTVANAEDWDLVWKYIVRNKAFDLLYKRLNNAACRERWEAKKDIPGISAFRQISLSLTKRGD